MDASMPGASGPGSLAPLGKMVCAEYPGGAISNLCGSGKGAPMAAAARNSQTRLMPTRSKSNPHQKFRLVQIAVQQSVRVHEMLRAPAREADFRRDVNHQRFDIQTNTHHEAPTGVVTQFRRIGSAAGAGDDGVLGGGYGLRQPAQ